MIEGVGEVAEAGRHRRKTDPFLDRLEVNDHSPDREVIIIDQEAAQGGRSAENHYRSICPALDHLETALDALELAGSQVVEARRQGVERKAAILCRDRGEGTLQKLSVDHAKHAANDLADPGETGGSVLRDNGSPGNTQARGRDDPAADPAAALQLDSDLGCSLRVNADHVPVLEDPAIGYRQEEVASGSALEQLEPAGVIGRNLRPHCPEPLELVPHRLEQSRYVRHLSPLGNDALYPVHENLELPG